jgi:hypothetical protein
MRKPNPTTIWIDFDGVRYYCDPQSKNRQKRSYFYCGSRQSRERGTSTYHRDLWIKNNGPVPRGFHIHHKDGNSMNNDLSNLECIDGKVHNSEHSKKMWAETPEIFGDNLERARAGRFEWLKTDGAKAQFKKHGDMMRGVKIHKPIQVNCIYCGKEFTGNVLSKYCSRQCRHRADRVAHGLKVKVQPLDTFLAQCKLKNA